MQRIEDIVALEENIMERLKSKARKGGKGGNFCKEKKIEMLVLTRA